MIELSDREKAIVALGLSVGLVVGLWAGLWMLPAEALDVPTHERESGGQTTYSPAFYPVPSSYLLVSILAPIGAAWYARAVTREPDDLGDQEASEPTAVTDGGTKMFTQTDVYETLNSELERYREKLRRLEIDGDRAIDQAHAKACRREVRNLEEQRNQYLVRAISLRENRDEIVQQLDEAEIDAEQIINELEGKA